MDKWVIAEDSNNIRCRLYMTLVTGGAALILCGGLCVPFTVRNSIPGGDPFQLATFTWGFHRFPSPTRQITLRERLAVESLPPRPHRMQERFRCPGSNARERAGDTHVPPAPEARHDGGLVSAKNQEALNRNKVFRLKEEVFWWKEIIGVYVHDYFFP
ncbi:hypothetical protein B0T14DRAFT_569377 [Immersiella caudata]|uniref:Uncharacterized protein n=1 Tax=Immersiella caudata TaxID=314043 RepID=A0AA40BTQ6_9PEZI|nr:hypothetical protein B0T14DRAFT_569377 [Immersiella caudata]